MTSITTIVEHRVRTTGLEQQGQNSISDPDQNLGFTCIFHQVCKKYCSDTDAQNSDHWDRFVGPYLTLMSDSYNNMACAHTSALILRHKDRYDKT